MELRVDLNVATSPRRCAAENNTVKSSSPPKSNFHAASLFLGPDPGVLLVARPIARASTPRRLITTLAVYLPQQAQGSCQRHRAEGAGGRFSQNSNSSYTFGLVIRRRSMEPAARAGI